MTDGTPATPRRIASRAHFEADLVRKILAGVHPPGSRLPSERSLALSGGLSRPVVREVLRSLVERGLIEVIPARGAFVRVPDPMQLGGVVGSVARYQRATPRDLVEARNMIESQSARRAADQDDADGVRRLRDLVRAFDAAGTTIERAQCDLALHATIAQLSGNPVLGILFGALAPLVMDLQLRSLADPAVLRAGAPLHHDIVEAIAAGNGERAAAAMSEHILLALELYGPDLDVPLNELAVGRLETLLGDQRRLDHVVEDVLTAANIP